MLKKISYSIIIALITLFVLSCENDNKGYKEYYHPMGNNPVQVVPWLKSVRKSLNGKEARISHYTLYGKPYYTTQFVIETDSLPISPYTIYEASDIYEIVYFHTDDALVSEQDSIYIDFIENADLVNILWSNESKYAILDEKPF